MHYPAALHHPLSWRDWSKPGESLATPPRFLRRAIVQRWERSSRRMIQPPLDHHYVVLHLGGAKRVTRRSGRHTLVRDVPDRALSVIETGNAYHWDTEGPIAFAHLYLEPGFFAQSVAETFDVDPAKVRLVEMVGHFDPLLASLVAALVRASENDDVAAMQREMQLEAVLARLFELSQGVERSADRHRISPASLRRVQDYVWEHLREPITLDAMASLAGYSRFHFARGFRAATGMPPYAYIIRRRIARACELLDEPEPPISSIAQATGFASHAQFSSRFRQLTGLTPRAYREIMR